MKKATILHLFLFVSFITTAQTYSVTYNVQKKSISIAIKGSEQLPASIKQQLFAQVKRQDSIMGATIKIYTLTYCNGVSTYALFQGKKITGQTQAPDIENQSNMQIQAISVFVNNEAGVLYKNFSNKIMLKEDAIYDKPFLITDTLQPVNWIIDTATRTIGKFNCTKATATINGQQVEAWFTADIPIQDGPEKFYGLPGLILAVKTAYNSYEAAEIKIINENTVLQQPTKGTVITPTEFTQLEKKKVSEATSSIKSEDIKL